MASEREFGEFVDATRGQNDDLIRWNLFQKSPQNKKPHICEVIFIFEQKSCLRIGSRKLVSEQYQSISLAISITVRPLSILFATTVASRGLTRERARISP